MVTEAGTQKRIAERLGITEVYLSDILHGKRKPGAKVLKSLGLRRVEVYEPDK